MPDKNETVSFRIDSKLLKEMKKEAKSEQISLNALVHKIFFMHVNWHSNAMKANMISIPLKIYTDALELLTDDEIKGLSQKFTERNIGSDFASTIGGDDSAQSFFRSIQFWAKACGFESRLIETDDYQEFIIQHNAGKKFSLRTAGDFIGIFDRYEVKYEVTHTEAMLKIKLYDKI